MNSDAALHDAPFTFSGAVKDEPASTVIEAVSWAKGVRPDELGSLLEVIDVDALNELFLHARRKQNPEPEGPLLSFRYEGYRVTVEPGLVWVERA